MGVLPSVPPEVFRCMLGVMLLQVPMAAPQTYAEMNAVYTDKVHATDYNPDIRPMNNQSGEISVQLNFELVKISDVDDIEQTFYVNGFLGLSWMDERLAWTPASYGNTQMIEPKPKEIWRPRVILMNTIKDRDLFEDDYCTMVVWSSGYVYWAPGGIFPASCSLDMTKYPNDLQVCTIDMISTIYPIEKLNFTYANGRTKAGMDFFKKNNIWDLKDTNIVIKDVLLFGGYLPGFKLEFTFQRRPTFLVMTLILPVVFLSMLNILVYIVPLGTRIGFGMTCLLAQTLFMSITSRMLPKSTDNLPYVTVFLLDLFVGATLSLIVNIAIVVRTLKQEKQAEEAAKSAKENGTATEQTPAIAPADSGDAHIGEPSCMKYKVNLNHKDDASALSSRKGRTTKEIWKDKFAANHFAFIVFFVHWFIATLVFFTLISS